MIASAQAEVVVLSTLHQYHEQVPGYGYKQLAEAIDRIAPQVLALELSPSDLQERRPMAIKREYQEVVYPQLTAPPWAVYCMEPEGGEREELLKMYKAAQDDYLRTESVQKKAYERFTEGLMDRLLAQWTDVLSVNAPEVDRLFEFKHRLQDEAYPPTQAYAWERWNDHFLFVIEAAATHHPGQRILVLVGAEHAYWLRGKLNQSSAICHLHPSVLLAT